MDGGRVGGAALAGFWARLVATILDAAWMLPAGWALALAGILLRGGQDLTPGAEVLLNLISALVVLLFWASRQATPGKILLRLRIVDARTGGTPPWPRLVLRYLGYLVSALPLGVGYLWMLWDPHRQCWHDRIAGTLVVQDPPRG
ncbi:RDD family protein [Muricoccus radiodurans]|uniref:RDD family protein n=1 Tax=Muricoccus radiodurans TaxID=2231721 RepID=UPI003CF4E3AA